MNHSSLHEMDARLNEARETASVWMERALTMIRERNQLKRTLDFVLTILFFSLITNVMFFALILAK